MANIQVGEVEVEGGRYQVILRRIGAAVGPGQDPGAGVAAPAPGVAAPGALDNPNAPIGGRRGKKQGKKAKGTRKLSPYMKFAQEARPKILKENPDMKSDIIGVGRKIGEMWRALSDAEKAQY